MIPLIPLGLKETKDVDFSVVLKVKQLASVFKMGKKKLLCIPRSGPRPTAPGASDICLQVTVSHSS